MQLQALTWAQGPNGSEKVSHSIEEITGISAKRLEQKPFLIDEICHPGPFSDKLKRICEREQGTGGTLNYKLLARPVVRFESGIYTVAALLIFEREGERWMRTIWHLFLLAPEWWVRLPNCCRLVVKQFASLLPSGAEA